MFELGDGQEKMHGEIGHYAVTEGIDVLVCVGELSYNMFDTAVLTKNEQKKNTKLYYMENTQEAIDKISDILENGDTILVKASHGMNFAEIVKALQ